MVNMLFTGSIGTTPQSSPLSLTDALSSQTRTYLGGYWSRTMRSGEITPSLPLYIISVIVPLTPLAHSHTYFDAVFKSAIFTVSLSLSNALCYGKLLQHCGIPPPDHIYSRRIYDWYIILIHKFLQSDIVPYIMDSMSWCDQWYGFPCIQRHPVIHVNP